jgi:hypothetical protein
MGPVSWAGCPPGKGGFTPFTAGSIMNAYNILPCTSSDGCHSHTTADCRQAIPSRRMILQILEGRLSTWLIIKQSLR